jgi:hypothetical protein
MAPRNQDFASSDEIGWTTPRRSKRSKRLRSTAEFEVAEVEEEDPR